MHRLTLLVVITWGACSASPVEPCTDREIAFVHAVQGPWRDEAYHDRPLIKNLPVCSDSRLVRIKEGLYAVNDYLELTDLMGQPVRPRFNCSDLLSCKNPVQLSDIREKVKARLSGMSPSESLRFLFERRRTAETSTISRPRTGLVARDPASLVMKNAVVLAGAPLTANAVFAEIQPGHSYNLDLCFGAEKHNCGDSMPKSKPYRSGDPELPFGKLPSGLHILYEVNTLPGDDVPLRTVNRVFVLAADPSWTPQDLDFVRTRLALALISPDITAQDLDADLQALGVELSHLSTTNR